MRIEPLFFTEACLGNEDYLPLLEQGLEHTHVALRQLARNILDQAMRHPDELAQLPPALREEIERLHQKAYSSEDDSSGGSASRGEEEFGQYLSSPAPTFPKSTPKTPTTIRTVQNNVYKIPTYRTPQAEMPKEAMTRFRQLPPTSKITCLDACKPCLSSDAAAYLFGLIRKALQGTFHLWARQRGPARPPSNVQEAPRETPKAPSGTPSIEPTDKPTSKEVASASIQIDESDIAGYSGCGAAGSCNEAART